MWEHTADTAKPELVWKVKEEWKLFRVITKLHPEGQVGGNQMKEGVQRRGGTLTKETHNKSYSMVAS